MNLFGVLGISSSAMTAQRQRAEVVAANMANSETTRTSEGGPYQRKQVIFSAQPGANHFSLTMAGYSQDGKTAGGVRVAQVVTDPAPPIERFDPSHPDADERGYVAYPNINPVTEMVDLMGAVRSYQLNAAAVNASKQMIQQSIDLLR